MYTNTRVLCTYIHLHIIHITQAEYNIANMIFMLILFSIFRLYYILLLYLIVLTTKSLLLNKYLKKKSKHAQKVVCRYYSAHPQQLIVDAKNLKTDKCCLIHQVDINNANKTSTFTLFPSVCGWSSSVSLWSWELEDQYLSCSYDHSLQDPD